MARSKSISATSDPGFVQLTLDVTETSYSSSSNTSTLSWTLTLSGTSAGNSWNASADARAEVEINGTSVHSSYHAYDTRNGSSQLASGSLDVSHDSDGTKKVVIWARMIGLAGVSDIDWFSGELELTPNSRASKITAVSGNELGSPITITIQKGSSSFTHQVWFRFQQGEWIDLGKFSSSQVTFTPPASLASRLTGGRTGLMDISIRTFDGGTQVGDDFYWDNHSVGISSGSGKPTIQQISFQDVNRSTTGLVGNNFLQYISRVRISYYASGYQGSSISSYYSEVVGSSNSVTGNNETLNFFRTSGRITIRSWVTDSRGVRSNPIDSTINVIPYSLPTVTITAQRAGAQNNTISVIRNVSISPVLVDGVKKNRLSMRFQTKKSTETNWTDNSGGRLTDASVETLVNSAVNLTGTFSPEFTYDVRAIVEDKYSIGFVIDGIKFDTTVQSESAIMSFTPNGVGIMKIREKGALDVGGDIYSNGNLVPTVPAFTQAGKSLPVSSQNMNNYFKAGTWAVRNMSGQPVNVSPHGYLTVVNYFDGDNKEALQYYVPYDSDTIWLRRCVNFRWQTWVKFEASNTSTVAWENVRLRNWWSTFDDNTVQVCKVGNIVHMRGAMQGGNTNEYEICGYLPSGYVPSRTVFASSINASYDVSPIKIHPDGKMQIYGNRATSSWMCFDGVSYTI